MDEPLDQVDAGGIEDGIEDEPPVDVGRFERLIEAIRHEHHPLGMQQPGHAADQLGDIEHRIVLVLDGVGVGVGVGVEAGVDVIVFGGVPVIFSRGEQDNQMIVSGLESALGVRVSTTAAAQEKAARMLGCKKVVIVHAYDSSQHARQQSYVEARGCEVLGITGWGTVLPKFGSVPRDAALEMGRTLLKKHLRPELLNRIDETVVFHQLRRQDLAGIVEIQAGSLRKRLKARGLDLQLTPAAVAALADEGYDPAFGARPLKRVIQQRLENPIAERMLKGEYGEGETVRVDFAGKSFTFGKGAARVEMKA